MRAAGVRSVLVYCSDYRCSHSTSLDADQWADDVRLSDIEAGFVCTACGRRGADVRPDWESAQLGAVLTSTGPASTVRSPKAGSSGTKAGLM